jgi:two-component system chemotaxis response regulator CheY
MDEPGVHRLLVVDDYNVIRRRIERANDLADIEFIGAARNGVEALEMHQRLRPTLVTMDLTMPEMDGAECVEKLVERDPALRILVISALADKLTAIEAIEKGASGFLCKPFTDRQLNDALETDIRLNMAQDAEVGYSSTACCAISAAQSADRAMRHPYLAMDESPEMSDYTGIIRINGKREGIVLFTRPRAC